MMAYGKDYEVSYIVSVNFRANLDAQNAGNCISRLQISNIFWGTMPPPPIKEQILGIHAWYVGHMAIPTNILSHRKVPFQKMPPIFSNNYARYVWRFLNCAFHPWLKYILWIPSFPTICSNRRSRTSEGPLTVKETCPKHQLLIHHKKRYIGRKYKIHNFIITIYN